MNFENEINKLKNEATHTLNYFLKPIDDFHERLITRLVECLITASLLTIVEIQTKVKDDLNEKPEDDKTE